MSDARELRFYRFDLLLNLVENATCGLAGGLDARRSGSDSESIATLGLVFEQNWSVGVTYAALMDLVIVVVATAKRVTVLVGVGAVTVLK